jgi:hypothetical protein
VEFWQKKKKTIFLPDLSLLWMIASPLIWKNCKKKKLKKNPLCFNPTNPKPKWQGKKEWSKNPTLENQVN